MCRWRHDGGCINRRALTSLRLPTRQLAYSVPVDLTRKPRNFILTLALRAVTGGAGGNVGFGKTFLEDSFPGRDRSPGRSAERFGIEPSKMRGQRRQHRRAQHMRDVEHDRIGPPALDEGPQLSLDVFGLLPGKPRHRKVSEIPLARQPMAGLAIFQLGLQPALSCGDAAVRRVTR